ncbi:MAG TPA: hypothetical protein PLX35_09635 [Cyclobacteriaceae bacterium]|nr:hypothetical protein [Cyclobacteriaceae bacterium]
MNVLVFATTVQTSLQVRLVQPHLDRLAGKGGWNFDLADCDRILRITRPGICAEQAIRLVEQLGFQCTELEDLPGGLQFDGGVLYEGGDSRNRS